jgi:dTMP kinase
MSGLYVTVEGPDGVGKSTLISNLSEFLKTNHGLDVVCTKEPGSPLDGACTKMRAAILDEATHEHSALLLFLADRAQNCQAVVAPALEKNGLVLQDRSSLSTITYYLAARTNEWDFSEVSKEFFSELINFAQPIKPDLCLLAAADEGFVARDRPRDRIEERGQVFQKKVEAYFDQITDHKNFYGDYFSKQNFFPKKIVRLPSIPKHCEDELLSIAAEAILSLRKA